MVFPVLFFGRNYYIIIVKNFFAFFKGHFDAHIFRAKIDTIAFSASDPYSDFYLVRLVGLKGKKIVFCLVAEYGIFIYNAIHDFFIKNYLLSYSHIYSPL